MSPLKIIATAFVVAAAFGGSPVANGAPNTGGGEWDIAAYDECIARGTNARLCCSQTGGVWTKSWEVPPNTCVAPPAAGQSAPGRNPAVEQNPGGVATQTLEPAP